MAEAEMKYPVVDVFAGPGGLGEGFASLDDSTGTPRFPKVLFQLKKIGSPSGHFISRHFLRTFPGGGLPDDYYLYLKGWNHSG